ncbi:MAG: right-handed parallel beta-helix repeat-containing protein, partial [Planctomycetota bacterium]
MRLEGLGFYGYNSGWPHMNAAIELSGSSATFQSCRFEDWFLDAPGIRAQGGAPRFEGCIWRNIEGGLAGGLEGLQADLTLLGCVFEAVTCPVKCDSGGITAGDCLFLGCSALGCGSSELCNAGMHLTGCTVNVSGTTFDGMTQWNVPGERALYLEVCTTTIHDCVFRNGRVDVERGAAMKVVGGTLGCDQSSFTQYVADRGGAVALEGTVAGFSDCLFAQNRGDLDGWDGGAIHSNGSQLDAQDCQFLGNRSDFGAAVSLRNSAGTFAGCAFSDNSAQRGSYFDGYRASGGGIYSDGPLVVHGCTFEGNRVESAYPAGSSMDEAFGGAIYAAGSTIVTGSVFRHNEVEAGGTSEGGAIWSSHPGTLVRRCVFEENRTLGAGTSVGGALVGQGQAEHCTLVRNQASVGANEVRGWTLLHCIVSGVGSPAFGGGTLVGNCVLWNTGFVVGTPIADPLFWGAHDFHLQPGSPAIDLGGTGTVPDPDGSPADAGAFMFDPDYCGPGCDSIDGWTYCQSTINSTGDRAHAFVLGSDLVSAGNLVLCASEVPLGQFGYFLMSQTSGFFPFFGNSQGHLCLGGQLLRWNDQVLSPNAAGVVSRRLDLGLLPQGQVVQAGDAWHFQFWFRDHVGGMGTSNTSSGVRVDFQ